MESFLRSAEQVWTGRIIKRDTKYIFKSNSYGAVETKGYNMDKSKILVLISMCLVLIANIFVYCAMKVSSIESRREEKEEKWIK